MPKEPQPTQPRLSIDTQILNTISASLDQSNQKSIKNLTDEKETTFRATRNKDAKTTRLGGLISSFDVGSVSKADLLSMMTND